MIGAYAAMGAAVLALRHAARPLAPRALELLARWRRLSATSARR